MTTNEYIRSVKSLGWIPFNARLWQRNYYERVIRNEEEMCRIRQYIADNPAQWTHDRENPHMDGPVRPT
jgi:REP element-mobilizing transposase RayT